MFENGKIRIMLGMQRKSNYVCINEEKTISTRFLLDISKPKATRVDVQSISFWII